MNKRKVNIIHILIIVSFILLNLFNTYFQTTLFLNRYISPLKRTFKGELTAFFSNFAFLFFIVTLTYLIFKKDKLRFKTLIIITLILNVFIFLLNIFSMYYSNSFTISSLDIFKNPSEGISDGLLKESLLELILYYRILIFIPFITLLTLYIIYKKEVKNLVLKTKLNFEKYLIAFLSIIIILITTTSTYIISLSSNDYNINAINSTSGIQNYGLYPYYVTEFLGIKINHTSRKSLNLKDENMLFDAYDEYNKNKDEYINFIDLKTYSNDLKLKDSIIKTHSSLNLLEDDSLTGIFEDKNLMLIHLESLNHFLFDILEIKEEFNFLNKILSESVVFENYYTSVGMGVSSDAELSILTGLYPDGYQTFYWDFLKGDYNLDTIVKKFNDKNYVSKPFHGDHPTFYNRDKAYEKLIGFNQDYYTLLDFALRDGFKKEDYKKYLSYRQKGYMYNDLLIESPWPSEFELFDVVYEYEELYKDEKYMFYPMFLTQHTPFLFNPYSYDEFNLSNLTNYDKLKPITKRYIEYVKYIDELIESIFINPQTKNSRINEDTVYIFYSDHGSSIKNGDLKHLYNKDISVLEERMMLQKTYAFIYAPSNEFDSELGINKGLIKGVQNRVRTHTDMYRTILELFNLSKENDIYFGTHGFSLEPNYVIDGRVQDLIIDNINDFNNPYITSLRNPNIIYPNNNLNNQTYILNKIIKFKKLNDLYLLDDTVHKELKTLYKSN